MRRGPAVWLHACMDTQGDSVAARELTSEELRRARSGSHLCDTLAAARGAAGLRVGRASTGETSPVSFDPRLY